MSNEVVLKKSDGEFIAAIPHLGIIERAPSAEAAYEKASLKQQAVVDSFRALKAEHLLNINNAHSIEIKVWSTRLKKWMILSLAAYFVGLMALGFVIKRSADRMVKSLQVSLFDPDPKRVDKNVEKFRALLVKYRPFIEEWNKINKNSDRN